MSIADAQPILISTLDKIEIATNFAAFCPAMIVAWLNDEKQKSNGNGNDLSTLDAFLLFGNYLLYVSPNFPSAVSSSPANWGVDLNDAMTGAAIIKAGLDGLIADPTGNYQKYGSPILECIINVVWLVADGAEIIQINDPQTSDWISFSANVCFDISGILAPFASPDIMPEPIPEGAYVMSQLLTRLYGVLCCATGFALAISDLSKKGE